MNLNPIVNEVIGLTKETAKYIKTKQNLLVPDDIESKGLHDFVSYVDKTSEKKLVDGLSKILPAAGFIAEENTSEIKGEKYNWIIDPLDGTTNFIHGLSPYAISIALIENNKVILAVVHEISLDECFYASLNNGAFLNNNSIKVSVKDILDDALIATGFPYYDFKRIQPFLKSLEFFMKNTHGVRRLGSAATDLAYVACGRFEAFYEYGLNPWDVAAGSLIVTEAGGCVSDFNGKNNYLFGKEIVATNKHIYSSFYSKVAEFMKAN